MADIFTVLVDFTDRTRHDDRTFVMSTTAVRVLADDDTEATLVAAQIVAASRGRHDGFVTRTTITDVRI